MIDIPQEVTASSTNPVSWYRHPWLFGIVLVLATFAAYYPAWRGGFVWDDDSWTRNIEPLLRDGAGLGRMWTHLTALQQYYPLTGTTFWIDHHLWGDAVLPYHLENIGLHALSVLLFWRLLNKLQVPGARLAAGFLALHPVMVESVAWITERKSVLCLPLFLGSLLAYGRYSSWEEGQARRDGKSAYCGALLLFTAAMLAKVTAFALPAVILLLRWWKRGRLGWKSDFRPLLPFFAVALALGSVIWWLEVHHVGAEGSEFAMPWPQRVMAAGRAFWFYPAKLLWPQHLCFVYPEFAVNAWQWLFPLSALGLLVGLWLGRSRLGRGPLTALLYYVGMLAPVSGLTNAYGMRYALVWNHWVYMPSLGLLALAAALIMREGRRAPWLPVMAGGALAALAAITWVEAGVFRDLDTLWRVTIKRNPRCWMAHYNWATELVRRGDMAQARAHFDEAIRIKPDHAKAHNNLGLLHWHEGRTSDAIAEYRAALAIDPEQAETHFNLGIALVRQGALEEALPSLKRAAKLWPDRWEMTQSLDDLLLKLGKTADAQALCETALHSFPQSLHAKIRCQLAAVFLRQNKPEDAAAAYRRALQDEPDGVEATLGWANLLITQNRLDEAEASLKSGLRSHPAAEQFHVSLGVIALKRNNLDEALAHFSAAVQAAPTSADAHYRLAATYQQQGLLTEATQHYELSLKADPNYLTSLRGLAWLEATCPDASFRNGDRAIDLARRAVQVSGEKDIMALVTLGAALAEAGHFDEAAVAARRARDLAVTLGQGGMAQAIEDHIRQYQSGSPIRDATLTPR